MEHLNLKTFYTINNVYYFTKNIQSDIIGLLDEELNPVVKYQYDAWGSTISIKDNNGNNIIEEDHIGHINPFRYRGYYLDKETNLYYLNTRYYNPELGRFINADGILGANKDLISYNLFAYCSNNPVMYDDPSGMFLKKVWNWVKSLFAPKAQTTGAPNYCTTTDNLVKVSTKINNTTYNYTVNTKNGDIAMDLSKNPKNMLQTRVLAKEMLKASGMKNRTVSGVSTELTGHYIGYWGTSLFGTNELSEMFRDTNIGTPGQKPMDWNAPLWEVLANPHTLISPLSPIRP